VTIKQLAQHLIDTHGTSDPFRLADALGINVLYCPLGMTLGYYMHDRRNKIIVINDQTDDEIRPYICAHELGHSLLHNVSNLPFLSRHTLFSIDKIERQADTFAAELLLPDTLCREHADMTIEKIGQMHGVPLPIIKLKALP